MKPHDWDYSKTPWRCKACFREWQTGASPSMIQDYLLPTCEGSPFDGLLRDLLDGPFGGSRG